MNSDNPYSWLSFIADIVSLIGLLIALWQISKTRRAAEAAKDASLKTQKDISHNLSMFEISACVKHVEEIKSFVRYAKYESAQIRINDLVAQLIQTQEVLRNSNQPHQIEFEKLIKQLSNLSGKFERKLADGSVKINTAVINGQLSLISDSLNKFIGGKKITIKEEKENG